MASEAVGNDQSWTFPQLCRMLFVCNASMRKDITDVVDKLRPKYPNTEIDFDCQEDIEKGMKLWQQQIFDVALVQTSLGSPKHANDDETEKPWHYQHSESFGGATLASMEAMLKDTHGAPYAFLEKTCAANELPTLKDNEAVDGDKLLKNVDDYLFLFSCHQTRGYTPAQTVARTISLYRNTRLLKNPGSPATVWMNRALTSLDGYLILSKSPIIWLNCIAHNAAAKQFVYVTNRAFGDMSLPDDVKPRRIYLGPVSRDDRRPVWVLVNFLFNLDANEHEKRAEEQHELLPLASKEQMHLIYRAPPDRRAAFKGPRVDTPRVPGDGQPRIEAAATPLTGVSTIGLADAHKVLLEKAKALLAGPFDSLVLKTVCQDTLRSLTSPPPSVRWPALQSQSHHRTRCLRSVGHPRTLWNTGVTALEMFTPEMLNDFLNSCASHPDNQVFGPSMERLVVSLGSKFPKADYTHQTACYRQRNEPYGHELSFKRDLEALWHDFFGTVFRGLQGSYPTVEINVRHYLRESIEYHIGGDEYLSPDTIHGTFSQSHKSALMEFTWWIESLDAVARAYDKRLVLKLPFRSDLLAFIRVICDFFARNNATTPKQDVLDRADANNAASAKGIHGICLINAFKASVCDFGKGTLFTPAWYSRLDSGWGDAKGRDMKYQMSGEMLSAARNQLMHKVLDGAQKYGKHLDGFQFRFSGGVITQEDIAYCSRLAVRHNSHRNVGLTVQVGTWGLLDLNLGASSLPSSCTSAPPASGVQPAFEEKCKKCGKCKELCPQGVLTHRSGEKPVVTSPAQCNGCDVCRQQCPVGAVVLVPRDATLRSPVRTVGDSANALNPRFAYLLHERCTGCGKCSRSFYCDSFLDRQGKRRHPLLDPRNCTGCGLCAQLCGEGALQLFESRHVAVLISSMGERSDILRTLMLPHMVYDPERDLDLLMQPSDKEKTEVLIATARRFMNAPTVDENELIRWSVALWIFRLRRDHFVLAKRSEYRDERWERLGVRTGDDVTDDAIAGAVKAQARGLLNDLMPRSVLTQIEASVVVRAFVWSQIIWSDPGQVLWDSPLIVVRTTIVGKEGVGHPTEEDNVKTQLRALGREAFSIASHYAVLQKGKVVKDGRDSEVIGPLTTTFNMAQIDDYASSKMGLHRLAGLDVRACPTMLKHDGLEDPLHAEEIRHIAGIPWEKLKNLGCIGGIEDEVGRRLEAVSQL